MEKIKVIVKRPDEPVGHIEEIDNTLETLQKTVGGYIETVSLRDGGVMLVDEDGRMKRLSENLIATALCGRQILGNVLIVGQKEELLTDVPSKYYALLAIDMV